MADSFFQQAVHKVKEALAPSASAQQSKSDHVSHQAADGNSGKTASVDTGMMQSLFTAGLESMSKEDPSKVQEFQQNIQANSTKPFSPNNHNGKMDIAGNVISSAMRHASADEQQQLQQFQQALGMEAAQTNNEKQTMHSPVHQMELAEETAPHVAQQAASKEKTQLEELANELENTIL